jgi:hypothetical protein
VIVVIDSSTRGFAVPEADTPALISLSTPPTQDQDENGSVYWFMTGTTGPARGKAARTGTG